LEKDFVLIVGDGKSYDHLIKLKSEYGSNLDWVLPYPGDWHILKNVLQIANDVNCDFSVDSSGIEKKFSTQAI
jgi:hypothetical protein